MEWQILHTVDRIVTWNRSPVGAGFTNHLCEKPKISKTRPHPTTNPNLLPHQVNLDYAWDGGGLI